MSYFSLQMYPQALLTQWLVLGALPGSLEDKSPVLQAVYGLMGERSLDK